MLTRIRRLPSPALVISALALIVAVGGGTFAVAASDKKEITKKDVKKISKSVVKDLAPDLSVDHAKTADSATTAATATHATTADGATVAVNAGSAQPTAFAHVDGAGVLDAANSKNVGTVTSSGPLDCFSGISFDPTGGQATVDAVGSGSESAQFGIGTNVGICPAGTQAHVATIGGSVGYYVVFYK